MGANCIVILSSCHTARTTLWVHIGVGVCGRKRDGKRETKLVGGELGVAGSFKPSYRMCSSPGIVPAMGLDEVHVSVFGQEGHQLVIGPETQNDLVLIGKTYGETSR